MNRFGRTAICLTLILLASGCTGRDERTAGPAQPSSPPASDPAAASASALPATGCGETAISTDALPTWAHGAGLPTGVPYAQSREANVVAILFGYPLHVGEPADGRNNKILWYVRHPRDGQPLTITARHSEGEPTVSASAPAGAGPGEIYPSIVDVPSAGCWHMTLEWNGHTATIELPYGA
jgi:hypothetical protein